MSDLAKTLQNMLGNKGSEQNPSAGGVPPMKGGNCSAKMNGGMYHKKGGSCSAKYKGGNKYPTSIGGRKSRRMKCKGKGKGKKTRSMH